MSWRPGIFLNHVEQSIELAVLTKKHHNEYSQGHHTHVVVIARPSSLEWSSSRDSRAQTEEPDAFVGRSSHHRAPESSWFWISVEFRDIKAFNASLWGAIVEQQNDRTEPKKRPTHLLFVPQISQAIKLIRTLGAGKGSR